MMMAKMNPSKLKGILDELPRSYLSVTKQNAISTLIERYLNGEIVMVVRCKDCVHFCVCRSVEGFYSGCDLLEGRDGCEPAVDDDWFCAYGERRDENT